MTEPTSLLVATVKNEGPNILEWVAHHRLCGFDRIQIYQNDSTDTTVQTLRTLDRLHQHRHLMHRGAVIPGKQQRIDQLAHRERAQKTQPVVVAARCRARTRGSGSRRRTPSRRG